MGDSTVPSNIPSNDNAINQTPPNSGAALTPDQQIAASTAAGGTRPQGGYQPPAAPASTTGNNPGGPSPVPGTPVPAPNNVVNDPNHHATMIGKVFQALAGGKTTDYVPSEQGPIAVKRDLAPGEMARNILASAFSLIGAGAGGALAAREKRPYQQVGPTVGEVQQAPQEQRKEEATDESNRMRLKTQDVLTNQKYAQEQQDFVAKQQRYADEHLASVQSREAGSRENDQKDWDNYVKNVSDYQNVMSMPGAKPLSGPDGKPLSFSSRAEMAQYASAHPDVIHGSHDGVSMFGVLPVQNPLTHQFQLIDMPADRNTKALEYEGAKRDKDGKVMFDKDNNPIPDGTYFDPISHKPTVLTQIVTPDQARAIKNTQITQDELAARTKDYAAQAAQRDAAAKKDKDLGVAIDLIHSDKIPLMNDSQLKAARQWAHGEQTLYSKREEDAAKELDKATQAAAINPDDAAAKTAVTRAQQAYNEAKQDYNDSAEVSDRLYGRTPATKTGTRLLQDSKNPASDWMTGKFDASIKAAGLSDEDQVAARNYVWNNMPASQKAAIQNQNRNAAATANTNPAPTKGVPYVAKLNGQDVNIDADGNFVLGGVKYHMNPDGKGGTPVQGK